MFLRSIKPRRDHGHNSKSIGGIIYPSSVATHTPSGGGSGGNLIFYDNFDGGTKAPAQNGAYWGQINIGSGGDAGSVYVTPDPNNVTGYSLAIQYNPVPEGNDNWVEPRYHISDYGLPKIYIEATVEFPANYKHNRPLPNNNKFIRVWDNDYQNSWVHLGASISTTSGTGENTFGQYIGEYSWTGSGGAMGSHNLGPYTRLDAGTTRTIGLALTAETAPQMVDGRIRCYVDNLKKADRMIQTCITSNLISHPTGAYRFRNGHIFGWANSGYQETTIFLIKEFKIYDDLPAYLPE